MPRWPFNRGDPVTEEILDEEVESLIGKRHSRARPQGKRLCRWGHNPGSIRIDGERVPQPAR